MDKLQALGLAKVALKLIEARDALEKLRLKDGGVDELWGEISRAHGHCAALQAERETQNMTKDCCGGPAG